MALGSGELLNEILGGMDQVAEGIHILLLLKAAGRRVLHLPRVNGFYDILHEHRPVLDVFDAMMHR